MGPAVVPPSREETPRPSSLGKRTRDDDDDPPRLAQSPADIAELQSSDGDVGESESDSDDDESQLDDEAPPFGDIAADSKGLLVLVETPSRFALFCFNHFLLYRPNAVEDLWTHFAWNERARNVAFLREVMIFKYKSSAINFDTGVNAKLARMIKRWHCPGMILLVRKPEYKSIIEEKMGILCLHDENVMEVMWGFNIIMKSLYGEDKTELAKEDHLPVSKGLQLFLARQGFEIKPEMISQDIIETACVLHDCVSIEWNYNRILRDYPASCLKDVSGINTEGWDLLKLVTALKIVCYPEEDIVFGDPQEMFSRNELSVLVCDAHKYNHVTLLPNCWHIYKTTVKAYEAKVVCRRLLKILVNKVNRKKAGAKKAKKSNEAASMPRSGSAQSEATRTSRGPSI
ncbi:hypothetical protein ACP70R_026800 [Stipagrostis hirtigluma subsp. patula]